MSIFWNKNSGCMVKFIVLIWTMPGVKLLVCVENMNEDVCRLGSMYCFLYHYGFWMILVLNIEIEVFNLNNLWTLLPPKKSRPYIPKWDIQNKKLGGEGVLSTRIFLDSYSYSMWKPQGWIQKKKGISRGWPRESYAGFTGVFFFVFEVL